MFSARKLSKREKNIKENDFFIFDFTIKRYERKLNIIKIIFKKIIF